MSSVNHCPTPVSRALPTDIIAHEVLPYNLFVAEYYLCYQQGLLSFVYRLTGDSNMCCTGSGGYEERWFTGWGQVLVGLTWPSLMLSTADNPLFNTHEQGQQYSYVPIVHEIGIMLSETKMSRLCANRSKEVRGYDLSFLTGCTPVLLKINENNTKQGICLLTI